MDKTGAIKAFLTAYAPKDLANYYSFAMEVQVNVTPEGDPVEGEHELASGIKVQWQGWTDGLTTWKHMRIPWNNGQFTDSEMRFSLEDHAEAIGMTGWNWQEKKSVWVGFDFDSLVGHVKGLNDQQLQEIVDVCSRVPWVSVRRSKSGKGIHLYVFFDTPVPTDSRSEHAALARAVLGRLVAITGMDLRSSVDKLGCNLWVWHRHAKATGLSLIKEHDCPFAIKDLPLNWKSHVDVIEGKTHRPNLTWDSAERVDDLVGKTKHVSLDEGHRRLLGWFATQPTQWWWDQDRHMLVCHTYDLLLAYKELGLKGLFYTNATGKERGKDQNCFAFPVRGGGWIVRRHGQGTQEHPAWTRDVQGWTKILLNLPAEIPSASAAHGGLENAKGEFVFPTALKALAALKDLGAVNIPQLDLVMNQRSATLARHKGDHRLLLTVKRENTDNQMPGWLPNKKGDKWEMLISLNGDYTRDIEPPDELVRHCVAASEDDGWYVYSRNTWVKECRANAVSALVATGMPRSDIDQLLGQAILNYWEVVSIPFEDEYPGNRRWNKRAAKLAVLPKEGPHPTWSAMLRHCGHSLNSAVRDDPWCQKAGITDGGQYLLYNFAAIIQEPFEPTPYLFLWSKEQNTGKSTLHEAFEIIIPRGKGYVKADNALLSDSRFNAELIGQVLCVIEEVDLRQNRAAYDRVKDWVTGKTLSMHMKGKTPFDVPNHTHYIQCANDPDHCPILPGDTRITMIHVRPLEQEVPKAELMAMLRAEAPAFLHTAKHLHIPPAPGRMRVPVLNTPDKKAQEDAARTDLDVFFREHVFAVQGHAIRFDSLYDMFIDTLRPEHRRYWTKRRFSRELPSWVVKGRYAAGGYIHLGNVSLDPDAVSKHHRLVAVEHDQHNGPKLVEER